MPTSPTGLASVASPSACRPICLPVGAAGEVEEVVLVLVRVLIVVMVSGGRGVWEAYECIPIGKKEEI